MNRKEELKLHVITVTAFVVFIALGLACATSSFSQNSLEQGQYFALINNYQEFYDPAIPVEKQCYIVNIADGTSVRINGKPSGTRLGRIAILPPGDHDFYFSFYDQSSERGTINPDTAIAQGVIITTTRTNEKSQTRTLEAGHYYFIEWLNWTQSPIIGDLKEQTSLEIDGYKFYNRNAPVSSIIKGMNAAIKRVFPDFEPPF